MLVERLGSRVGRHLRAMLNFAKGRFLFRRLDGKLERYRFHDPQIIAAMSIAFGINLRQQIILAHEQSRLAQGDPFRALRLQKCSS